MEKNRKSIFFIIGLFIFLISFILPAFSERFNVYGFQTALIAFALPFQEGFEENIISQFFYRLHILFLAVHNILLPVVVILSNKLLNGKYPGLVKWYLFSTLNTMAFFFVNFYSVDYEVLLVGYYVWVAASVCIAIPLITVTKIWKVRFAGNQINKEGSQGFPEGISDKKDTI